MRARESERIACCLSCSSCLHEPRTHVRAIRCAQTHTTWRSSPSPPQHNAGTAVTQAMHAMHAMQCTTRNAPVEVAKAHARPVALLVKAAADVAAQVAQHRRVHRAHLGAPLGAAHDAALLHARVHKFGKQGAGGMSRCIWRCVHHASSAPVIWERRSALLVTRSCSYCRCMRGQTSKHQPTQHARTAGAAARAPLAARRKRAARGPAGSRSR